MIEHFAFDRVQRAVDRSDVVILLIDATEKLSQVDEQLAMLDPEGLQALHHRREQVGSG
jgi:predicted GTPase